MDIQQNISLKEYNTFGIDATAKHFLEIRSEDSLRNALKMNEYPEKFIISGGSNMLITKDIDALVLHINIKGITIIAEDDEIVTVRVMAGENWHNFVLWALEHDYGGLENLSLIPGNTGTAPIQNIGAYGVELKDIFVSCTAMNRFSQQIKTFNRVECQFGYRDSFFKNEGRNNYIITSVTFQLTKRNHKLNTSYGTIETELSENNIKEPSIKDVSNAVVAIRRRKLPDPVLIGNSGSFFKNPVLSKDAFNAFHRAHPDAPYYVVAEDGVKVPAGWLIEQCGFKGKRFGDAGVHEKQALVLVNYGSATGLEVLEVAMRIQQEVFNKFAVQIQPEVNIIK